MQINDLLKWVSQILYFYSKAIVNYSYQAWTANEVWRLKITNWPIAAEYSEQRTRTQLDIGQSELEAVWSYLMVQAQ